MYSFFLSDVQLACTLSLKKGWKYHLEMAMWVVEPIESSYLTCQNGRLDCISQPIFRI